MSDERWKILKRIIETASQLAWLAVLFWTFKGCYFLWHGLDQHVEFGDGKPSGVTSTTATTQPAPK